MRYLHILPSLDPSHGGPVESSKQMARVAASNGVSVEFLTFDRLEASFLQRVGFLVHAVGRHSVKGLSPFPFLSFLICNRRRFDAVVISGIWGTHFVYGWIGAFLGGIPFVVYLHGMLDPWFKKEFPFKHLKKWLFWPWGAYLGLRLARYVLFTCEEERRLARQSFWLYRCNERVVNYGTPGAPKGLEISSAKKVALAMVPDLGGRRVFLFFGRVNPKKGPDILIKAIEKLSRDGIWNGESMCLVMAGPSTGRYEEDLKKLAIDVGVSSSIFWTGMVTGDAKWGWLSLAECFVLSSHQENFGIAVAEALSVGTPVLITRAVNIWETIIEENAGIAGEPTVESFAEVLKTWILLDDAKRAVMRENARRCFEKHYTIEKAAQSLLAAASDALQSRNV